MSKLTIIIVNYNVKFFLEQCLVSVFKALDGIPSEVIVVDNASTDGSVEMLKQDFPNVHTIVNTENVGFATANNQGIDLAKGKYVLLLNPDTIIPRDAFSNCIEFMEATPNAGALGVRMIDGTGAFLPESKRSFPGPAVSFYKLFGLSALFPKSKTFGKYHLTYLSEKETNPVDVLSGAFFFIRKEVLNKIGGLDETFFMYGEDIDLSYRIQAAGFENYYFPKTTIIHYKGESTKRGSLNYVKHFYQAMAIFAKKHFTGSKASVFNLLLQLAIGFRALFAVLYRLVKPIIIVLLDVVLGMTALYGAKELWEVINPNIVNYPMQLVYINFPIYLFIWIVCVFFRGGYDKPFKAYNLVSGIIWGTLFVVALYAFLPDQLRFSRTLIILGALAVYIAFYLVRWLYTFSKTRQLTLNQEAPKRVIIVSSIDRGEVILNKLKELNITHEFLGWVNPSSTTRDLDYLGALDDLPEMVKALSPNEVIVNEDEVEHELTISLMKAFSAENVVLKIASPQGHRIIGSTSKNVLADLYAEEMSLKIKQAGVKRNKRVFDLFWSSTLLIGSPILIWFYSRKGKFLYNCICVLLGKCTLVGYSTDFEVTGQPLPSIRESVIDPLSGVPDHLKTAPLAARLNYNYAKNYSLNTDRELLFRNWKRLDKA